MSTRVVFPRRRGRKGTHPLFLSFKGRGRSNHGNCERPGADAGTLQDFKDLHRDNMRQRKRDRYVRQATARFAKFFDKNWKNADAEWRNKGIWPKAKTARPGRMG